MTGSANSLEVRDVSAGYGGSDIITSVTLAAAQGRITTIAGPNGAGKSTLMKTLAGLLRPRLGQILIDGRDVTRLAPPQRALAGLGYVPQERNIFRNLTIGENLRIGFEFIRRKAPAKEFGAARDRVLDLFPDLSGRLNQVAGTLSGGQRQMLAMGCALVAGPTTLLLDEPSAGLSPRYVTLDAGRGRRRQPVRCDRDHDRTEPDRGDADCPRCHPAGRGRNQGHMAIRSLPFRSACQGIVSWRRQGESRQTRIADRITNDASAA